MSSLIEVSNVSKSFKVSKRSAGIPGMVANLVAPRYEQKEAVKDVSFQIGQGEMLGFIGANGAGKSTMIKMLSGILCPDSGSVCVDVVGKQVIRDIYGTTRQLEVEFNYDCEVEPIPNVQIQSLKKEGHIRKRFIFEQGQVKINELMNDLLRKIYCGEVR